MAAILNVKQGAQLLLHLLKKTMAVVIGGGMVGVETAEYLAEKGACVTVLEMLPEICADLGAPRKICVNESVYAAGIVPVTPCQRQKGQIENV